MQMVAYGQGWVALVWWQTRVGNGGAIWVELEKRQIYGCGVWRASREKMGGGNQGG